MVDDDANTIALVAEHLSGDDFAVRSASSLEGAIEATRSHEFDCVVLDLTLPDGWGLDTLLSFRRSVVDVPVVVYSGTHGSAFEAKARRAGASAFVRKGDHDGDDLRAAVRRAHRAATAGEAPPDPFRAVAQTRSPVSARLFGQSDLREDLPGQFDELAAAYGDLLELAMERTAFEGDFNVSDHLRAFARSLGKAGAGPRDVVQIHARALDLQAEERQGPGAPEFVQEARLVVLEVMGYLAAYYRSQALGLGSGTERDDS